MNDDTKRIKCLRCGTFNLVSIDRIKDGDTAICGKCKNKINSLEYPYDSNYFIENKPSPESEIESNRSYDKEIQTLCDQARKDVIRGEIAREANHNPYKNKWILPTILLAILLLAYVFRWDYTVSKSSGSYVLKWKTDRWTGQKWIEQYSPSLTKERPMDQTKPEDAWSERIDAANIWNTAVTIDVAWLLYVTWIGPKRRMKKIAKLIVDYSEQ